MSVPFLVYDLATGAILRFGSVPAEAVSLQAGPGEGAMEGVADPAQSYVHDGQILDYPSPRPTLAHRFDPLDGTWRDDRGPDELASALAAAKVAGARQVVEWAQSFLDRFTSGYPSQEVAAWSRKIDAARAVLAGGEDLLIEVEAEARGIPPATLAAKVLEKGETFERIVALTSALRSQVQDAIAAASTEAEIGEILTAAVDRANAALTAVLSGIDYAPPTQDIQEA